MTVVLDNNALVYLLNPKAKQPVRARLNGLLKQVEEEGGRVLIPTPVLAEYLSHVPEVESRRRLMSSFRNSRFVAVVAFDELAAEECALLDSRARASGDKRVPLAPSTPWQAVKVDRQIVAIAKARGASIVSGDGDVLKVAAWAGVKARKVEELPIPESDKQLALDGVLPPHRTERRLILRTPASAAPLKALPPSASDGE